MASRDKPPSDEYIARGTHLLWKTGAVRETEIRDKTEVLGMKRESDMLAERMQETNGRGKDFQGGVTRNNSGVIRLIM